MIPVKHIDPDDLALYAMQLLPQAEREELELQLQHSVEARKVLAEIYSDLSILAHTTEPQSPSEVARQRLLKNVAQEKKIVPIDQQSMDAYTPRTTVGRVEHEAAKRGAGARVLPWIGWAIAAGMLAQVANLYQQRERLQGMIAADQTRLLESTNSAELANSLMDAVRDPAAVQVTLTSSEVKPPPQGRASYVAAKGSLIFLASNLEPLKAYKTYELWLIPSDGRSPIAAGTFRPDARGNASVVLPQLPKGVTAKAFGVTIEDGEGSTAPTLPIILQGLAS